MDVLGQHIELNELHDLLMHAEATVYKLAQISGSHHESFMDGSSTEKMRLSLSDLLQEIESLKVEYKRVWFQVLDVSPCITTLTDVDGLINFLSNRLDRVLHCDAGSISFPKNLIRIIKRKLMYLGHFLADVVQYYNMHQGLKDLTKCVLATNYVCFFSFRGYKPACYYLLYFSDVNQLLKFVEAEVEMIFLKAQNLSSYSFPKTNGLGFLNCFLGNLEELLYSKLDSIIDLNSHPLHYKVLWISKVVKNINLVNEVVSETCGRKKTDVTVHKVAKTSMNIVPSLAANTSREHEEIEGFQEAMDKIKKQLLGRSSNLDIISIVGIPGIGKTTLAEKIYNDLIVTPHFDVHAKCRVTQVYSWKELLLTILNDVLEPADRTETEDVELANELCRFLLTKRFLILIHDVWDKTVWDHLYMCFRDVQNGSRIILTTQLSEIAIYAKCESEPHHLRLFRDDESWTLLQEGVFQGESCPRELGDVGFRIAKSYGGLPLFIMLVAGVLKEKNKKADLWEEVEESLGSQIIGNLGERFLKGKDIHVSKLTQLWQAEGFVQANKEKRTETAQDFLEDLISRNLVTVIEERPNNKDEIDLWRPCRSNVRSLQFNVTDPDNLLWPPDISFIFESFKLVTVLDLESFNIGGTFPSEIQSLIHLRYFAVQTDANSVPSFIANLWNLETLVVRGLGGEVILPCSLFKMVRLRHILVKHSASFSLHENMDVSLANSQLVYLDTFCTPCLSYAEDAEMILVKMPYLRKLNCIVSGTFCWFPIAIQPNFHVFSFPSKLRALTLSKFRLPWSEISIIGELLNLEILRLLSRAFEGNDWEVNDSEFPELKYLNLENINISQLSVCDNAFPKLERLVLTKCKQLEEIPSRFGETVTLKSIEVHKCGMSVANSAMEIQRMQQEVIAKYAFKVIIQPPY
ncbi:putative receptor-like protein kinase HERK 1-like [Capsicum annuum]|nr:putative receptor-like protein kinase HERK 1-like [Capsicum annuum]